MKIHVYCLIISICLTSFTHLYSDDNHTVQSISQPSGYKRFEYQKGSFPQWISRLPIKNSKIIKAFNGSRVYFPFYNLAAVVNKPILFKKDLEQCADYAMRFWADFHKEKGELSKLYLFSYGGKKRYYKKSRKRYKRFLEHHMIFSNSFSIKSGGKRINEDDLLPGDMIVQNVNGGIGHVSVIMDMCENKKRERLYLIGYSFMPAQEFHIESAANEYGRGGWFTLKGYYKYLKENLDYGKPVLRRF